VSATFIPGGITRVHNEGGSVETSELAVPSALAWRCFMEHEGNKIEVVHASNNCNFGSLLRPGVASCELAITS
jgi:hypothetical protein